MQHLKKCPLQTEFMQNHANIWVVKFELFRRRYSTYFLISGNVTNIKQDKQKQKTVESLDKYRNQEKKQDVDMQVAEGLARLIQQNNIVAITADDQTHSYLLMKVTRNGTKTVRTASTDSYNNSVQPRAKVSEGQFFGCQNVFDRTYKLCVTKNALIYIQIV